MVYDGDDLCPPCSRCIGIYRNTEIAPDANLSMNACELNEANFDVPVNIGTNMSELLKKK